MLVLTKKHIGNALKYTVEAITNEDHTRRTAFEALKDATVALALQASNIHHTLHGIDSHMMQHKTSDLVDYAKILFEHHERNIMNTASSFIVNLGVANYIPLLTIKDGHDAGLSDDSIEEINRDYVKLSSAVRILSKDEALDIDDSHKISEDRLDRITDRLDDITEHLCGIKDIDVDDEVVHEMIDNHKASEEDQFIDALEYINQDLVHSDKEIQPQIDLNNTKVEESKNMSA